MVSNGWFTQKMHSFPNRQSIRIVVPEWDLSLIHIYLRLNAVKIYSQASCAQRPLQNPKDFVSAVVSDTGSRARA